jgi:hypothetical protein
LKFELPNDSISIIYVACCCLESSENNKPLEILFIMISEKRRAKLAFNEYRENRKGAKSAKKNTLPKVVPLDFTTIVAPAQVIDSIPIVLPPPSLERLLAHIPHPVNVQMNVQVHIHITSCDGNCVSSGFVEKSGSKQRTRCGQCGNPGEWT